MPVTRKKLRDTHSRLNRETRERGREREREREGGREGERERERERNCLYIALFSASEHTHCVLIVWNS